MGTINTVVFDIARVLVGFEWDDYMLTLMDEETAEIVSAATIKGPYWKELDYGNLSTEEIIDSFVSLAPEYEKEIREAVDRIREAAFKVDYTFPWIDELHSRGYRVLYLSNLSDYFVKKCQDVLDFIPRTDGGILSYWVHHIKPEAAIFRALFHKFDLKPEECVFLDDTPANVEGAINVGMKGIVFENYEQAKAELDALLEE